MVTQHRGCKIAHEQKHFRRSSCLLWSNLRKGKIYFSFLAFALRSRKFRVAFSRLTLTLMTLMGRHERCRVVSRCQDAETTGVLLFACLQFHPTPAIYRCCQGRAARQPLQGPPHVNNPWKSARVGQQARIPADWLREKQERPIPLPNLTLGKGFHWVGVAQLHLTLRFQQILRDITRSAIGRWEKWRTASNGRGRYWSMLD